MSEVKVNKISPRTACGTTTLGDSGDTFTIPAGVTITNNGTQTGFGRSGAVNWDTTAKTAGFTGVSGNGYFINTTSGAITVNLPASPSAGDIMALVDYAGTANTNAITVGRNGSNINGAASDLAISKENSGIVLVYVDGTRGWKGTETANLDDIALQPKYICATGGTIKTSGNFKTHIFTGPGTFTVSCGGNPLGSDTADYFVVAGGGGTTSGGGGAGGFRISNSVGCVPAPTMSPLSNPSGLPVSVQGYPITVGAGGTAGSGPTNQGSQSIFSTITSTGGGHGESNDQVSSGGPGGSGGGGGRSSTTNPGGGSGNTPPVSPPQGNNGASTGASAPYNGGGGGGAGSAATPSNGATTSTSGAGSFIADTFIGGCAPSYGTPGPVSSTRYFSGGGGAGSGNGGSGQVGGVGGGGTGSDGDQGSPGLGGTNTGGGAGGSDGSSSKAGGSGIVMIRYKFQN
jgi:hypothetical protein